MMPPTRGSLHLARKQILLARRGYELLKRKQDALIMEFFKLLKLVLLEREALQREYARAAHMLAEARALESDLRIKSAALAVQEIAPLTLSVRNIAGVRLPEIAQDAANSNAAKEPVYDSLLLQDVGHAYRNVVERTLRVAARETALRKVLIEIRRVKRRTKALSEIVIPRLESEMQRILLALDEREREDFLRIRNVPTVF